MKEKVCLIIPPSPFLLDERVFMSLGILKVAAVVKKQHHVEVLDLSGVSNPVNVVTDYLETNKPNHIGITVTTPQLPAVVEIIGEIRIKAPGAKVVLGGPHVTLVHSAFQREQKRGVTGRAAASQEQLQELADVLVAGDGEKAALLAFSSNPPKLINADDPKTELFLGKNEIDQLPWPDRDFINVDSYHYTIDGVPALSLVSQLGCPFGCGFCGGRNSPSLRRMRSRSPENVLAEMEHLHKTYGIRGFMFYDDELNVNRLFPQLMRGVIDLQKKLGVEFRLRGFVKSQLFTVEQAELMYEAGFRWTLIGFESGSSEMLLSMNKRATVEENSHCIEIAKRHGLKVKALMSLGHPGESSDSAKATRDWLLAVKPDDFDITVITVYPGTPYYDDSVPHSTSEKVWVYTATQGTRLYSKEINYCKVADFYKGDPNGGYESFVFTDHMTQQEIVTIRNNIEREVRQKLNIPFPAGATTVRYEHSMGQQGYLPSYVLK